MASGLCAAIYIMGSVMLGDMTFNLVTIKMHFSVFDMQAIKSWWSFAHVKTAMWAMRVQNFGMIQWL